MSKIFLSYRRADTIAYAGRLYDRLADYFGKQQIFMDVDRIEPGEDFADVIENSIGTASVLIVLIGPRWANALDDGGSRRLDNPDDFVRLELSAALAKSMRIIPVLVGGASVPRAQDLPQALRPLARRHAFDIIDTRFHADVDRLIEVIDRALSASTAPTAQTVYQESEIPARKPRIRKSTAGASVQRLEEPGPVQAGVESEDSKRATLPLSAAVDKNQRGSELPADARVSRANAYLMLGGAACLILAIGVGVLLVRKSGDIPATSAQPSLIASRTDSPSTAIPTAPSTQPTPPIPMTAQIEHKAIPGAPIRKREPESPTIREAKPERSPAVRAGTEARPEAAPAVRARESSTEAKPEAAPPVRSMESSAEGRPEAAPAVRSRESNVGAKPEATPTVPARESSGEASSVGQIKLSPARYTDVVLSDAKNGRPKQVFAPDTPKVFLRAKLTDLPNGSKLKSVWIAEKTYVAPPNYEIDSAEIAVEAFMNRADFELSRPHNGWPPGDYRVELLINGRRIETVRFKIGS